MRRIIHKIHLWAGLILAAPLILQGLTGSIQVIEPELRHIFAPLPASASGTPHSAAAILDRARAEAPDGFAPSMLRAAAAPGEPATVFLARPEVKTASPGPRIQMLIDPVSLAVIDKDASRGLMRKIVLLHSSLLLRDYGGRSVVGWFGVGLLGFGLSGLILWWPRPGSWRAAFSFRRKSRGRCLYRELHGAAGIWSVLLLLTAGTTGVYLAFPRTMDAVTSGLFAMRDWRKPPPVKSAPAPGQATMNIDDAIRLAIQSVPDGRFSFAALSAQPRQPYRIGLLHAGDAEGSPPVNVFIDPWTESIMEIRDPRRYAPGETILAWMHAVHAGQALGGLWRVLVFLTGLMPMLFAVTGLAMWLKRPRK